MNEQGLPPVPGTEPELPVAKEKVVFSNRNKVIVAAAVVAGLVVGGFVGVSSQSGAIDEANRRAVVAVNQADAQQAQLDACIAAVSNNVEADGVLNALIYNALNYGSIEEWDALGAEYDALGQVWVIDANTCDPDGDYSFVPGSDY